jgi:bla regulator protein BlaR1
MNLAPVWNHVWQSTLCAAVAWALTLVLRNNRAAVRYWIWLAASVKFLVPFSLLIGLGGRIGWRPAPALRQSGLSFMADEIGRSFAAPVPSTSPQLSGLALNALPGILLGVWLCGFCVGVIFWIRCWARMRDARRSASPLNLHLSIRAMSSPTRLEPGVFGIRKPVLLLPEGIADRLTPTQLELILAHELCHVERRDNLTAALHMAVETIFWFHPPVWYIRARLIEERERACDEEVLKMAADPNVYAEGILNVCKFYVSSPLACAPGVTGADLKKRIESIVANRTARNLTVGRRSLLISTVVLAVAGPVAVGVLSAVPGRAQSQGEPPPRAFEAASVKPNRDGIVKGSRTRSIEPGRITYLNVTLGQFVELAYGVKHYQVSGADWMVNPASSDRYDVIATAGSPASPEEIKRMLRPLLAERFHLALHRDTRELPVFALVPAKGGLKIKQPGDGGPAGMRPESDGAFSFANWSMTAFADWLAGLPSVDRPVLDRTGLEGVYSFKANLFNFPKGMSPGEMKVGIRNNDDAIFTTLAEQLGLKLEPQKAAIEMLVIDHAEKSPTEN